MKNILFVDDEPMVLKGLARTLHPLRSEWHMSFVSSGTQALEEMTRTPFDVLVTDMRMPGISGSLLLAEVSNHYPDVIRIVLSGMCEREEALSSVAGAHQFLAKPCDPGALKAAVERALAVKNDLASSAMKGFISRIASLPSLPSVYSDLVTAAQDPNASAQRIGAIVLQDMAMTSKILHIVNSPLFGIRRRVLNPSDACIYLGVETIQTLVLSLGVFSQYRRKGRFDAEDLQAHSLRTAAAARRIAKGEGLPKETVEECFLAGMLHDVGKLVMAVNCAEEYDRCLVAMQTEGRPIEAIETETFGVDHADAGMYLLRLWGMPEGVTAAVALHHAPARSPQRTLCPLPVVHAADAFVNAAAGQSEHPLDMDYFTAAKLVPRLPEWRRWASEPAPGNSP